MGPAPPLNGLPGGERRATPEFPIPVIKRCPADRRPGLRKAMFQAPNYKRHSCETMPSVDGTNPTSLPRWAHYDWKGVL